MLRPRTDACPSPGAWTLCDARWAWDLARHPFLPGIRGPGSHPGLLCLLTGVCSLQGAKNSTTAQLGFTARGTGSKLWPPAVHEPTGCAPVGPR